MIEVSMQVLRGQGWPLAVVTIYIIIFLVVFELSIIGEVFRLQIYRASFKWLINIPINKSCSKTLEVEDLPTKSMVLSH